jgi:hypothetical protein
VRILETLLPSDNGLTIFDAETQETSYGIERVDGLPFIFDTHRKDGAYVATLELLTEVATPVRVARSRIERLGRDARGAGLLPLPYSGCFFKGNLHVYAFYGPLVGYDLAALGTSVSAAEFRLRRGVASVWPRVPTDILRAQRDLLRGRRRVRHPDDLEVLRAHAGRE